MMQTVQNFHTKKQFCPHKKPNVKQFFFQKKQIGRRF